MREQAESQGLIPPLPTQPTGQQSEPSGSQPRRSGRARQPVTQPDSVYGNRTPAEIEALDRRRRIDPVSTGPAPTSRSPSPGSPSNQPAPTSNLAQLSQEGGNELINFLLAKAVDSSSISGGKLPDVKNVKEWHYKDLMRLPDESARKEWKTACLDELEALNKREVFKLTDLPKGRKTIGCRWVFDVKTDGRKKARLVAQGFSQVEGLDFNELFSPVVRFETVRLMFAVAALEAWYITGVDVKSAFLYGKLDEEIYMRQPEGFIARGQERKVLRLQRAIYGLKQAGLAWWKQLKVSMKALGFKSLSSDAGIFFCYVGKNIVIAIVYVDDCMFVGNNKRLVDEKKKLFMDKWECRDLGEVTEYLRMNISRSGNDIHIDQCAYLKKVLERFDMINAKSAPTPLPTGWNPTENKGKASPQVTAHYQAVIGSLLYLMLGTRPDISYAVTKLSKFCNNPSQEHLDKAMYIMRYLVGTQDYRLTYKHKSNEGLHAYTDSDWAADTIKRRSITGYFFKLAGSIICWKSFSQTTIALSSTEAEYMALSDCARQAVWMKTLLSELGLSMVATPIYGDNQGSIFIASNPITEKRSKHIDIRYHYVRDCVEEKKVELMFIPGEDNPADMLTKNLGRIKFEKFRDLLGLDFNMSTKARE
jgi:hypothetical protein